MQNQMHRLIQLVKDPSSVTSSHLQEKLLLYEIDDAIGGELNTVWPKFRRIWLAGHDDKFVTHILTQSF